MYIAPRGGNRTNKWRKPPKADYRHRILDSPPLPADPTKVWLTNTHEDANSVTLECFAGDGGPVITGGAGGYEAVPRPGKRPLTVFRGFEPLTIDFPLMFDGWGEPWDDPEDGPTEIEKMCRELERMAGFRTGMDKSSDDRPSPVWVRSHLLPVGMADSLWVITNIAETSALREGPKGNRVRWAVTVTFWEYVQDDRLSTSRLAGQPTERVVQVKKGDTWEAIAKRELGDRNLARRLAKKNQNKPTGTTDKKFKHPVDVRVPIGKQLEDWRKRAKADRKDR